MSEHHLPVATMTKTERTDLTRLIRQRARVAKAGIEARQAQLLADFEEELAAQFPANDPRWAEITRAAEVAVRHADQQIAEECARLGVRPEFRPGIRAEWYGRGENGDKNRRAELRKAAERRIAAAGKAAKLHIDSDALDRETELVAGSLSTAQAKAFLDAMPTLEQLMPPLSVAELEAGS